MAGTSTLQADKIFAQLAIWLVSAFANQGASERTNKYLAEIHSKKRAQLNLEKGEVMLEVKMRFEHYGWCKGTITGKVVDRRRTINKEAINFIAEFDIDDGRLNGPLARCVGVRPLAIGRLPVVAAAAGGGGLICRRRGRVGRGLGRLGCGYYDRIAQVPAACWMPVLYLGARVYAVNIGPMQRTLTRWTLRR